MIETFTANNPPMYARSTSVDSRAINLFQSGETVGISKRVLDQQANGANLPDDNLFSDLTLLEPSAFYNDDLTFQQSKIIYSKSNLYDFDEVIFYRYKTLLSSAKTVVVPMSGGYDSRLNLAFAKKYQQDIASGQGDLFGMDSSKDNSRIASDLPPVPEWKDNIKLNFAQCGSEFNFIL